MCLENGQRRAFVLLQLIEFLQDVSHPQKLHFIRHFVLTVDTYHMEVKSKVSRCGVRVTLASFGRRALG